MPGLPSMQASMPARAIQVGRPHCSASCSTARVHPAGRKARLIGPPDLDGGETDERAVPLSAFRPDGHWAETLRLRDDISPERVLGGQPLQQLWKHMRAAIEQLPAGQRAVLVLRDLEGRTAGDAHTLLGVATETQRALRRRARGRIRGIVDALVGDAPAPAVPPVSLTRRRPHASPRGRGLGDAVQALRLRARMFVDRRHGIMMKLPAAGKTRAPDS